MAPHSHPESHCSSTFIRCTGEKIFGDQMLTILIQTIFFRKMWNQDIHFHFCRSQGAREIVLVGIMNPKGHVRTSLTQFPLSSRISLCSDRIKNYAHSPVKTIQIFHFTEVFRVEIQYRHQLEALF